MIPLNREVRSMTRSRRFPLALVAALVLPLFALGACGSDDGPYEPDVGDEEPGGDDSGGGGGGSDASYSVWSALYGGDGAEEMEGVLATSDGGYVVVGATSSWGQAETDAWIVKVDTAGGVLWQKTYGGSGDEILIDVKETSDGGIVAAGWTDSFGAGSADLWVMKLTAQGDMVWQNTYGGSATEQAWSVDPTSDGGYVVAGGTTSFGAGGADVWILKLDGGGSVIWQKAFGGAQDEAGGGEYGEYVARVFEDGDGDYVAAAETFSFGSGQNDIWVLKLDPDGSLLWQKAYGGAYDESLWMIAETADGKYLVPGVSVTFSPDETGDVWALQLASDGTVEWQNVYALSSYWFEALSVTATADGGSLLGTYYEEGDSDWDFALLRLGSGGESLWQRKYEYGWDWPNALTELDDGRFVVAGVAWPADQGREEDLWLMKTASDGTTGASCSNVQSLSASRVATAVQPVDTEATVTTTDVSARASSATLQQSGAAPSYLCGA